MNTNKHSRLHPRGANNNVKPSTVKGRTYAFQSLQPQDIFNPDIGDILDEFTWNREHERVKDQPKKKQTTTQERLEAITSTIREAQAKRHEEALNLGGF